MTKTILTSAIILVLMMPAWAQTTSVDESTLMSDLGLNGAPSEVSSNGVGTQLLVYRGAPIKVALAVGTERHLVFQHPVEMGIDPAIDSMLGVQVYDENLLLTASAPFKARVDVRDLTTGKVVPVDIEAYHDLSGSLARPVSVYLEPPRHAVVRSGDAPVDSSITSIPLSLMTPGGQKPIDMVDMMRFAAQQYYAPKRHLSGLRGAVVVDVNKKPVRLYRGDVVTTTPDTAWQVGGLTVTAVRVENKTPDPLILDPRHLVGRWHSAVFHHTRLAPKGGQATTMLYLISASSFDEALVPYTTAKKGAAL